MRRLPRPTAGRPADEGTLLATVRHTGPAPLVRPFLVVRVSPLAPPGGTVRVPVGPGRPPKRPLTRPRLAAVATPATVATPYVLEVGLETDGSRAVEVAPRQRGREEEVVGGPTDTLHVPGTMQIRPPAPCVGRVILGQVGRPSVVPVADHDAAPETVALHDGTRPIFYAEMRPVRVVPILVAPPLAGRDAVVAAFLALRGLVTQAVATDDIMQTPVTPLGPRGEGPLVVAHLLPSLAVEVQAAPHGPDGAVRGLRPPRPSLATPILVVAQDALQVGPTRL